MAMTEPEGSLSLKEAAGEHRTARSRPSSWTLALCFGVADLLAAGLVVVGTFLCLPARYGLIDAGAVIVFVLLSAAGVGLVARRSWAIAAARVASAVVLALGTTFVAALAVTASYLVGIYNQVGRGGALLFVLIAALVLPYLVILPAAQLLWARGRPGQVGQ